MAITVAQFHTHLEAARTAIGTADYATAESELLQAQTVLAGLPDGQDASQASYTWHQTGERLLEIVQKYRSAAALTAAGGGIQSTKLTYVRPTA